jgi:hypothetical protein
LDDFLALKM